MVVLFHILKVLGSELGLETSYPEIFRVYLVASGISWGNVDYNSFILISLQYFNKSFIDAV